MGSTQTYKQKSKRNGKNVFQTKDGANKIVSNTWRWSWSEQAIERLSDNNRQQKDYQTITGNRKIIKQ